MLKEQLLNEAKTITASVELDGIFESVELSPETQESFKTVFEQAVKKNAVDLAEKHILDIAEKAEEKLEEATLAATTKLEEKMLAIADKFFEHTAADWLAENKVEVHRGIKADLFESMFGGLKALFVEHNVELPAESVDVVAEMEEELQETKNETSKLFDTLTETQSELSELKRTVAVDKAVADLTESQKEKVHNLIEGLDYSDTFDVKLNAIVEMAKGSKEAPVLSESTQNEPVANELNKVNDADAAGLNFVVEAHEPAEEAKPTTNMNRYVSAAQKL
ncbi:head scaffolding protein [Acinetobacter phage ZZ1]|jgi:hypothetical protein|uniref:Prohead core scaffold protein n=3 Tax=Caudoviricetes TaxID=2731619 RepID=A0A410T5F5_9CAUD|nr:head scaffolding protein [Acinetobacter phage ZZ1]AFL47754.1 prohead core scaffold protein [Acinetobacter phage ZZ1]QAU03856.1 prohead core scaffold protein [Acinetobacter phage Henu6]